MSTIYRAKITGLPTLPMTLTYVGAQGNVVCAPNDAITAALAYNSAIVNAGVVYWNGVSGSDAADGLTPATAFLTLAKAFRTYAGAATRVVAVSDATVGSFDLRSTDASQSSQQFKWLDANGYNVTIRDTGPDLTTQTWVRDGVNTKCFTSTLAVSGSAQITRVLRTDQVDSYTLFGVNILAGKNAYRQFKTYTSAALLDAGTGDGFYWDNVGKVLWLKIGDGEDVEAQKAILLGLYLNSAGTSRIFASGSAIGFSGVRFEGVQFLTLDAASRRPEIWLHNCTQLWAVGKGADMTNAGWYVSTNSLVYASQADGANAFSPSATGDGLIMTVRTTFLKAGDQAVFPANATLQGISAHGGSSHVSWGSYFLECNGAGVADTCSAGKNDITWLVGCYFKGYPSGTSVANIQGGSVAASATRTMYLDSCVSVSPASGVDLEYAANLTAYKYNTTLASVTGGTPSPYMPGQA